MPRNIYLFLSLSLSLVPEYLSLPISSLSLRSVIICIFLSPHLSLYPVIFISFYHCKKYSGHIVFPSRSFVSKLLIWLHFAIHVYSSTTSIQLFLSLRQIKINPILEDLTTRRNRD